MAKNNTKLKVPSTGVGRRVVAPQSGGTGSSENDHPAFCFQHMRDGYCLSNCELKEKAALAETMHELSKLTWAQIHGTHRHGKGCERIDQTSIKGDSVPHYITDDVNLLAFRFFGKAPMVGFRTGRIFHIVWLDRNFTLYKH